MARDINYPLYGGAWAGSQFILRDDVLRTRGGALSYKLYEDLLRDPHCYAVMQKRYLAVISREWAVNPASERRVDRKAADMVREQLDALSTRATTHVQNDAAVSGAGGFDVTCLGLLEAILMGFSVGEVLWDKDGAEVYPKEIPIKDQRRFTFALPTDGSYWRLHMRTIEDWVTGEVLPSHKFIVHVFNGHKDNPAGFGLGSRLFWPVYFKKENIKFWLAFNDKYGSPTAVGKYPQGAGKEFEDDLLEAIEAIAQDAGVTIPDTAMIEFLEAQRSGTITSYSDLASYMDSEMSKTVLGETGTTNQDGSGGSRARDEVANNIRVEIAKADADLLSDTLNRTLVRWIVEYNFPGQNVGLPKIWRRFPELEEKENLRDRITIDMKMQEMGWRLTPEKVVEIYGEGYQPLTGEDDVDPALFNTIGAQGVQSLLQFLGSAGQMPRESAIASLGAIFGIPEEKAMAMVPEQEEEGAGLGERLASIFGGEDTDGNEPSGDEELEPEANNTEDELDAEVQNTAQEDADQETANLSQGQDEKRYLVWFSGRDEPVVVPATSRRRAIAQARKQKDGGSNHVARVRVKPQEFAEARPKDIASAYAAQSTRDAQPIFDGWMAQIQELASDIDSRSIGNAAKFTEMQRGLTELYPSIAFEELSGILGNAIAAADFAGRYEVIEDVPPGDVFFGQLQESIAFSQRKPKNCKKGYSCGDTCIERGDRCSLGLSRKATAYREWLGKNDPTDPSQKFLHKNAPGYIDIDRYPAEHALAMLSTYDRKVIDILSDPSFILKGGLTYDRIAEEFGEDAATSAVLGLARRAASTSRDMPADTSIEGVSSRYNELKQQGRRIAISNNRRSATQFRDRERGVIEKEGTEQLKLESAALDRVGPPGTTLSQFRSDNPLAVPELLKRYERELQLDELLEYDAIMQRGKKRVEELGETVKKDGIIPAFEGFRESLERMSSDEALAMVKAADIDIKGSPMATDDDIRERMARFVQITGDRTLLSIKRVTAKKLRAQTNKFGDLDTGTSATLSTVFHEMAHHLEFRDERIRAAAEKWRDEKAEDGGEVYSMTELTGGKLYGPLEEGVRDKFIHPYVGKVYPSEITEVTSTGFEHLTSSKDVANLYYRDRSHLEFIVGLLDVD